MSIVATRAWKAKQTTDLVGSTYTLTVTGEVDVARSNETAALKDAGSPGINQRILLLELVVTDDGEAGADVVTTRQVSDSRTISPDQYDEVTIEGQATVKVEKILS